MIVEWASSSKLLEVIIGTAERLKEVDAEYLSIANVSTSSMARIKTNRSKRFWILKDDADCRAELIRRGEEHTIPYWAKAS